MAVNIDFSMIKSSTRTDAPRTPPKPGKKRGDDVFIDVTAEGEIEPAASDASPRELMFSRRDQLSLFSTLLVLSTAFVCSHFTFGFSAEPPPRLAAYQVDLNSAGLEELILLEGIGELTAEKILQDRRVNGPFLMKDQLQRVKGIGPKTLERLRDHIVCR